MVLVFTAFPGTGFSREVVVDVAPSEQSTWTIDPLLFGSFFEQHWGDVTPGVREQCLANPSFEPWFRRKGENKTRLLFGVEETEGVAFPWEPLGAGEGVDFSLSPDRVNSQQSQTIRVTGGATAGVRQRVALPDYRCLRYKLRFYARAEGEVAVEAILQHDLFVRPIRDAKPIEGVTNAWRAFEVELDAFRPLPSRYLSHFGIADIVLTATGDGTLWIDQATLFPADCVEGAFNPETLANVSEFGPTLVRWPGGNYTSGYHWRDGIGPIDQRPTRSNPAWGGLVDNHVGTDEWLRFCELAGLELAMGCGFSEEITAQELAEWVEYCNGDISTPMGALRAENGHPEPYGVTYWGIGNETYGSYQIGHTDAETYAKGFVERAEAMKAVDPTIQVIAVGFGIHNFYRQPDSAWDRTVLDIAGGAIDLIDSHHYVHGPNQKVVDRDGAEPTLRAFFASDLRLTAYYDDMRRLLDRRPETRDITLVHYEWAALPRAGRGSPRRQTFANALVTASHYHTFFRNGDLVRQGAMHNFSYYVNPVPGHSEPPNPRTYISQLYASFAGGRVVRTDFDGPTYDVETDYTDIGPLADVPEIDSIGVIDGEGRLHICLVNRSLNEGFDVTIRVEGVGEGRGAHVELFESNNILAPTHWDTAEPMFQRTERRIESGPDGLRLNLPKHSLAHITID